jgi:hypothetical protein
MTAFQLAAEAEQRGLTLQAVGNYLDVVPARLCPPDFAEKLRAHKPQLLALLQTKGISWIEVFSECIGQTLFFCEDEDTKAALVEAGASEWSIYTKAELRTLCAQNRIAPISSAELRKLHEIHKTFHARIARGDGG